MATAKKSATPAKRRVPARPPPEETPVVGGRFLVVALIVGVMVFIPFAPIPNSWFQKAAPAPTDTAAWKVGQTAEVSISVITADYNFLSCVSDKEVDGAHCAFKSTTSIWPRDQSAPLDDNKRGIIQPYWTYPDNKMILVAGFWANPVVAMRLHDEPPAGVPTKKLARFVVKCQMRFVGELSSVDVRWNPGQAWNKGNNGGAALVARPVSCSLVENQD